ncbi:hypothetical protein AXF42_Ash008800 [Apostasia shenzhenica]|uniref:Uncharacterized protein n=1 Tax=Apostasia shenzhenica TaxID=1088818 RepID=A0A2I0ASI2_9ASPA|nr:hypothetical protein AXF42_Ash008800 [Apostasia shenzhenica]
MEIQMMTKDENVNQLQRDIQECTKDLGATRGMLTSISEERDHMWEEVKQLRERNMLMDCELKSLHKKIEVLDEDLLYKEGQISILQDSLGNKQFDIICNPSTIQELSMQ